MWHRYRIVGMGIVAGLHEITPIIFEHLCAGLEPEFPTNSHHFIDRAWYEFHTVFRSFGPPLSLAITGDCLHPKSAHTFDEFSEGNHDYYAGFVSPGLVQQIAESLVSVTPADYKRWESEVFGDQYRGTETSFIDFRAAYIEAAARKNALMIVIS
jgi:hypothetical protein